MTNERWLQIEKVFEAVSVSPPDRRPALLEEACAGDQELRQEVESLLACDADDEAFLSNPVAGAAEGVAREQTTAMVDKRIGVWRVTGVIGHGGMGAVYRAVRDDGQYDKEAALKLVRRGMASEADLRHFRRERQILARLEHPHIARLLDGGTTEEGLPYLVMEYVEGRAITDYCHERSLSVEGRLRLFRKVCEAVQYAHQSLVVHRDLKPANILVTPDSTPKLLDFGIAKLLDPDATTDDIALTLTTAWMLTPDYASPEQIRGENITAASDVYSLGAILYELLTGQRPHQIKGRSASEIERVVCQQETQRPSTVDGSRHLRGDLDNIVLRAMSKEPARRYGSVEQFSEDIRRHLDGLPVLARKDTVRYRAGKFLRRNRWPVAIGNIAAAGLILATAIAVSQANRAQRQFEVARSMAMTMLIDVNEKFRLLPGAAEGRKLAVQKGIQNLDLIGLEARNDPAVLWDLARGYEKIASLQANPDPGEPNLGDVQNGLRNYQQALSHTQAVERIRGRDPESLLLLCRIHVGIGGTTPDNQQANHHLNEALRLNTELGPTSKMWQPNGPEIGAYLRDQAFLFLGLRLMDSNPAGALDYFRKTSPIFRGIFSAMALEKMGDLEASLPALAAYCPQGGLGYRGADILRQIKRWSCANAATYAARILGSPFQMNLNNTAAAVSWSTKALDLIEANLAWDPTHSLTLDTKYWTLSTLGAVLADTKPMESVQAYSEVLSSKTSRGDSLRDRYGKVEPVIDARWQISYPLRKLGKRQEALQHAQQSVKEWPTANAHKALAEALLDLGRRDEALEQHRMAVAESETRAAAVPKNPTARAELAAVYEANGRYYELAKEWRPAHEWYAKAHGIWANWTNSGGVSNPFVIRREREMARAAARCDAAAMKQR